MLGIEDPWILTAYVLSILSAVACVVYSLYNWNKGADEEPTDLLEEAKWEEEEIKIEETL